MCEFVSFVVTTGEEWEVRFGTSLNSHDGIPAGWALKPGTYREAEWTKDDAGESLVVRVEAGEDPEEYRLRILGRYPTRTALLGREIEGIGADGTRAWYRDGQLHRDGDEPAWIGADGTRAWYKDGRRHRDGDEPAWIGANGSREWYKDGKLHRDGDEPAWIGADGSREWYKDGKRNFPQERAPQEARRDRHTAAQWEEYRVRATLDVAHSEAKLENVTRVGDALVAEAHRACLATADAAKADRHRAADELREACAALVRCNRACGLNADGSQRKPRARKAAEQPTLLGGDAQ